MADDNLSAHEENKLAAKVDRDADYRIAALYNGVTRAGQDGGVEGGIDVLALAELYYGWLKGSNELEKPHLEKQLRGESDEQ